MSGAAAKPERGLLLAWGLYLLVFASAFYGLAQRSFELSGDYDHLVFVPLVGGVLVWRAWPRLTPRLPHPMGLVPLLAGVWIHACARAEEVLFPQVLGAWLGALGLIVLLAGWRGAWGLRFPLVFLLLALPPPRSAIDLATGGLKRLVTQVAVEAMAVLDVPAVARGTRILLHGGQVEVDDACSGLKGLLAFVAIAALLARESPRAWQGGLLVLASLPAAFLANLGRVLVLTALAVGWPELVRSELPHVFVGLLGYALGFAALLGLQAILPGGPPPVVDHVEGPQGQLLRPTLPVLASCVVLAWGLPLFASRARFETLAPPLRAGGWEGQRVTLPVSEAGAVYVRYQRPGEACYADLYVQRGEGSRVGLHVPATCFPGEGFAPVSRELVRLRVGERLATAVEEVWSRGTEAYLSIHWYRIDGRDESEPDFVRLKLEAWGRRLRLAPQGSIVLMRLTTPRDPQARGRLEDLASVVVPLILADVAPTDGPG